MNIPFDIVKRLVELLANVDAVDLLFQTPLHLASMNGRLSIVKLLIDAGADINVQDIDGLTPLWLAVEMKFPDIIAELKREGADLSIREKNGWQPLHLASKMNNLDLVRELEILGADMYGQDYESRIPFQLATEQSVIDFCIKWKDREREDTLLHYASREDNVDLVQLLIDSGFDIDVQNKFGWTALNVAIHFGSNKVGKLLKEKGAIETVYSETKYSTHAAVQNGNIQVVKKILNSDPTVIDSRDNMNNTLLHYAARYALVDILELLIEKKADVNAKNYYGVTPLHLSCAGEYVGENDNLVASYLSTVRKLTPLSDVNTMDVDGNSPLGFAARKGHLSITKELIKSNADPILKNNNQKTPFELAVSYEEQEIMQYYKKEYKDYHHNTLLHLAAQTCNAALVVSLLLQNAEIDVKNDKENLPLHEAILSTHAHLDRNNSTVVGVSDGSNKNSTVVGVGIGPNSNATVVDVGNGSNSNATVVDVNDGPNSKPKLICAVDDSNSNSTTTAVNDSLDSTEPFHAEVNGNLTLCVVVKYIPKFISCTRVVEKLTEQGSNVDSFNLDGFSPIRLAARLGELDAVKILVRQTTNIGLKEKNSIGSTAMHEAAQNGHLSVLEFLIDEGALLNIENKHKRTPMHLAILNDRLDVVKFLLQRKADIFKEDKDGRTPFELAVQGGASKVIDFLTKDYKNEQGNTLLHLILQKVSLLKLLPLVLDKGANVCIRNDNGDVALHIAIRNSFISQAQDIMGKMGSYYVKNNNGATPLHLAVEVKISNVLIDEFVDGGININDKDKGGNTPLLIASSVGNVDAMKKLIKKGADVNAKNIYGDTPLHSAVSKGHLNAVRELIKAGANADVKDNNSKTPLDLAVSSCQIDIILELTDARNTFVDFINLLDGITQSLASKVYNKQSSDSIARLADLIKNLVERREEGRRYFPFEFIGGQDRREHYYSIAVDEELSLERINLIKKKVDRLILDMADTQDIFSAVSKQEIFIDDMKRLELDVAVVGITFKSNYKEVQALDLKEITESDRDKIFYYAYSGNLQRVVDCVIIGSVNRADRYNYTPLHYAALRGHFDVVKYLMNNNAAINATDLVSRQPIHLAPIGNNVSLIELLVNSGAEIESFDNNNWRPLDYSARFSNLAMFKYLVDQQKSNISGGHQDLLVLAIKNNNLDIVKYLIEEKGFDQQSKEHGILFYAAEYSIDVFMYLIEVKGANILSTTPSTNRSLLQVAARGNNLAVVKYLVEERHFNPFYADGEDSTIFDIINWANCCKDTLKYLESFVDGKTPSSSDCVLLLPEVSSLVSAHQDEIAVSSGTRPSSWMNICISWAKNLATGAFSIIPGLSTQYNFTDKNSVKSDNKNIPQSTSSVGWNKFLNNENIALASCVADALDNTPSRRYQDLMSKGVEVVPNSKIAVEFALRKFDSFVEGKIRNLGSKEQARIHVELKDAYPEIIASLERGVEFSGNVGLDNVLEKCKKRFCTNVLPKDKVSTCLSEIGVTKLGGNLNR